MYEYCFIVESFDGLKSKVIMVNGTGETTLKVESGLTNLITALNDLGSQGWECIGYDSQYRNNINFWTMKRAVVIPEPITETVVE